MSKKIAFALLVTVLGMLSLWTIFGKGTVGISDLRVCTTLNVSGYCSENREEFDLDGPDIYASAYIRTGSREKVTVRWVYILDGIETEIAEGEKADLTAGYHAFKLARPENGWQEGRYRAEIELLTERESIEFEIL
jgi:hypothetical protein